MILNQWKKGGLREEATSETILQKGLSAGGVETYGSLSQSDRRGVASNSLTEYIAINKGHKSNIHN